MANPAKREKRSRNWFRNEESGARLPVERQSVGNMPAYPSSYFGPLSNFLSDMDRMFENTFRSFGVPAMAGMPSLGMQMFRPNLDITSNDEEYKITAEVPGMDEKDIKLEIMGDGMLTIRGEKRQESSEERQDVYCTECSYGSFERTLSLPDDVDQENIEARFRNGILTITCPRTESSMQSRREIPISGKGTEGSRASAERTSERGGQQQGQRKAA